MASLLTSESGNQEKVSQYVFECRKLGLQVLPPDVNLSGDTFRVTKEGKIRFSLSAIKNVGTPAVASILKERETGGPYSSLGDFCRRVDLRSFTPRMLECLVLAGAFDSTGASRAVLRAGVEKVFRQAQSEQADSQRGQTSLFGTQEGPEGGSLPAVQEFTQAQALMAEKEVLGFYLSGHPLSEHEREMEHFVTPMNELEEAADGVEVRVAGLVRSATQSLVKRTQEPYGRFVLEDLHSFVEVIAWPEVYRQAKGLVAKDKLVALRGKVDRSGDRVQVVALEMIDLSEMSVRWAKTVGLTINMVGLDDSILPKVKAVCQRHPGKARVFFHMQTTHHGTMVMEAGGELSVKPSGAFLKETQDLLGEDCVRIEV
jgi:DNA polymerase-3 subunit alpha